MSEKNRQDVRLDPLPTCAITPANPLPRRRDREGKGGAESGADLGLGDGARAGHLDLKCSCCSGSPPSQTLLDV